jgi:two-component system sensor kinase
MKIRFTFGFQLTLLILIIALPFFAVKTFDAFSLLRDKKESSRTYLQTVALQCSHDLDNFIRASSQFLADLASLPEARQQDLQALQPILAGMLENHPEYANIRLMTVDGDLLVSAVPTEKTVSYGDRLEIQRAVANGRMRIGIPIPGKITEGMTLPIAMPLHDDRGEITATASIAVRPEGLVEMWRTLELLKKSSILLIHDSGLLTAKVGASPVPLGGRVHPDLIQDDKQGFAETAVGGTKTLNCYVSATRAPFKLVVSVPFRSLYAPITRGVALNLLADGLILLVAIGLAAYLVKHLRDRVNKLRTAALEMASGDLDRSVTLTGKDELADLSCSLEQMRSNLKDREDRLREANQELEAFAYSVSHDLRAPLRTITGFSEILLEEYRDRLGEEGARYLDRVAAGGSKMGELIDDLLQFSRLGRRELDLRITDMDSLLQEVLEQFRAQIEEQRPRFTIRPLGSAPCDRAALNHVFSNLISNALKYTRTRQQPVIEIGSKQDGDEMIYYVKDNGIGFDTKYMDKLTQVFQKLHADYEGTGVGLAIVKRVIDKHGGRLWADAVPDKGVTFYFSLPLGFQGEGSRQRRDDAAGTDDRG